MRRERAPLDRKERELVTTRPNRGDWPALRVDAVARGGRCGTGAPLDGVQLFSVYQPIVTIDALEVVAYAAFARGRRSGVPLMMSDLLQTAEEALAIAEFDRLCREVAAADYDRIDLDGAPLFVKTLPASLPFLDDEQWWGHAGTTVVLEVSVRALIVAEPAELEQALAELRDDGVLLALDRVGTEVAHRELITRLHPAAVKLDRRLIHDFDPTATADLGRFLRGCGDRSITVVAEGVESAEHADRARRLGASCGQGYFYGWPSALPAPFPRSTRPGLVGVGS
jgi:EAL domain-containing protein (putative c-di-GMP-specific phosphodiesterase class I)